jgi:UDP-glucose 4-epimerase
MKDKRVLITGGAGFIGSNLAAEMSRNNEVLVIDDLSSGHTRNIEHLLRLSNVRFIRGSITDLPLLKEAFSGIDYVYHEAALVSVQMSIELPLRANEVNVLGTLNVLEAARERGVKKVMIASSCAIYGNTSTLPVTESAAPCPESPYAVTKLTDEYYCRVFSLLYGLPTVCLRYFNVYGPKQDPNSDYAAVIPRFITQALRNQPLIIFGDGGQTRDFVFVADVVQANIAAAESEALGTYNVGTGQQTSVTDLGRLVLELTGRQVEIDHQPPKPGEVKHSKADISKAREFGYAPTHDIKEGIEKTIPGIRASLAS